MIDIKDEFLSEEDLEIRNMSADELIRCWNLWLWQAQANNDFDKDEYSHGVFIDCPRPPSRKARVKK